MDRVVYYIALGFVGVIRALPVTVCFALGQLVGAVMWAILPGYRRLARENLEIAFGKEKSPAASPPCLRALHDRWREFLLRLQAGEHEPAGNPSPHGGRGLRHHLHRAPSRQGRRLCLQSSRQLGTLRAAPRNDLPLHGSDDLPGDPQQGHRRPHQRKPPQTRRRDFQPQEGPRPRPCPAATRRHARDAHRPARGRLGCVDAILQSPRLHLATRRLARHPHRRGRHPPSRSTPPDSHAGASSPDRRFPTTRKNPTSSPTTSIAPSRPRFAPRPPIGSGFTTAGKCHTPTSCSRGRNAGYIYHPAPIP